MNKKKKPQSIKSAYYIVKRFGVTAYILLLLMGLIVFVLNLNEIMQGKVTNPKAAEMYNLTSIETSTIEKLKAISKNNSVLNDQALPPGRINPFAE